MRSGLIRGSRFRQESHRKFEVPGADRVGNSTHPCLFPIQVLFVCESHLMPFNHKQTRALLNSSN